MRTAKHKSWVGAKPESMPGLHVLLRLYAKQDCLCACGCGRVMSFERDKIDCDHKIPLRDGGENVEANLQLLLQEHHKTKTIAENVARGKERQHKAKAFTAMKRPSMRGQGFNKAPPQRRASTPLTKRVGYFPEPQS